MWTPLLLTISEDKLYIDDPISNEFVDLGTSPPLFNSLWIHVTSFTNNCGAEFLLAFPPDFSPTTKGPIASRHVGAWLYCWCNDPPRELSSSELYLLSFSTSSLLAISSFNHCDYPRPLDRHCSAWRPLYHYLWTSPFELDNLTSHLFSVWPSTPQTKQKVPSFSYLKFTTHQSPPINNLNLIRNFQPNFHINFHPQPHILPPKTSLIVHIILKKLTNIVCQRDTHLSLIIPIGRLCTQTHLSRWKCCTSLNGVPTFTFSNNSI